MMTVTLILSALAASATAINKEVTATDGNKR